MKNPVRVAVLGCGHWGRNLVRNFAELGSLVAIVDPNREAAEALAAVQGVPVRGEAEVLADPEIDAIATASPAPLHKEVVLRALDAGKHVFVEKPIALTMEDGEAMRDRALGAKRILMVGHVLQYHPAYRKLREMVKAGAIGPLRYVYSNRMSMGKFRTEEDVVWSFAPHDLSMILGLVETAPETMSTHGAMLVSTEKFDTAHLHMRFQGGLMAHVFTSWLSPFKEHKFVAIGETGSLTFDDTAAWSDKLTLTRHALVDGPALQKGTVEAVELEWAEPLKEECRHFLAAVESGTPPVSDAEEALRVLSALMRAEKSGRTGKPA
ncbi:Gfo/Idh/MocA family oxidoreductase [Rhizobiaceae bacterium]|nr:Gfo/Idh/MocA family oxidoreductase [Rhizobiaceae bacterium]